MSSHAKPDGGAVLPVALRDALRLRLEGEIGLPLLPDTATRVLEACQDEHSDLNELADLIMHDQSMAAHILRVANSVGSAPRVPILSLQQAIGRVGLSTVSDVAMAVALKERVFSVPGYQDRIRALWLHSAATACYAKEIADLLRKDLESAFLCGLLHDVGMPVVLQLVCDLVREGLVPRVPPDVMEAAMLEFHCELGARIAEAWNLGPWISAVIRHHHEPASAKFRPDEIHVIALADQLAYWALDETKDEKDFSLGLRGFGPLPLHEGALQSLLGRREKVLKAIEAFA